jgi:hypothetical protein
VLHQLAGARLTITTSKQLPITGEMMIILEEMIHLKAANLEIEVATEVVVAEEVEVMALPEKVMQEVAENATSVIRRVTWLESALIKKQAIKWAGEEEALRLASTADKKVICQGNVPIKVLMTIVDSEEVVEAMMVAIGIATSVTSQVTLLENAPIQELQEKGEATRELEEMMEDLREETTMMTIMMQVTITLMQDGLQPMITGVEATLLRTTTTITGLQLLTKSQMKEVGILIHLQTMMKMRITRNELFIYSVI